MASMKSFFSWVLFPEACYLIAATLGGAGVFSAVGILPTSLGLNLLLLSAVFLGLGLVLQGGDTS